MLITLVLCLTLINLIEVKGKKIDVGRWKLMSGTLWVESPFHNSLNFIVGQSQRRRNLSPIKLYNVIARSYATKQSLKYFFVA
ncbi:hypothetical protein SAMN02787100_3367 [Chryseobacterium sp. OV279]|nr:hypothetical protein SAMN02787100_3367 [Chryseobacterium sp. OV279]